jgi:hypothetical protein
MSASFPWPVTDEELLLNNALARTLKAYESRGARAPQRVRDVAAKLIVEAYDQGVRDEKTLAHYALNALRLGRS